MAKKEEEAKIIAFPEAQPKHTEAEMAESARNEAELFAGNQPPEWQRVLSAYLVSLNDAVHDTLEAISKLNDEEDREEIIYLNGRMFAFLDAAAEMADTLKKYGGENKYAEEALEDFAAVYAPFKTFMKE